MTPDIPPMRERLAAQSVIEKLLDIQTGVPERTSLARLLGRSPLAPDSLSWYLGAKGELAVGSRLAQLPPGWTAFHALPVGTKDSDIDHLVVGPGGVFTINTKHHARQTIWVGRRAMMVSGRAVPYLRNAEHEAARVSTLIRERMPLAAPVQPVIALVDPKTITVKERPDLVGVVNARRLLPWLLKHPAILTAPEVARLVALVDGPELWRASPVAPDAAAAPTSTSTVAAGEAAPAGLMARFDVLDGEVRAAGRRQTLWTLLGAAVVLGVGSYAVPPLAAAFIALIVGAAR